MGEMPVELEQVLEETGWLARWEARGEAKGEEIGRRKGGIEIARNALAEGATPEFVRKITGLPAEVITTL
jgi:predicted transposase YdaD